MPGLFSQIASRFSGGDIKLVARIEEFAGAYVAQGEVGRTLALKREETALLDAILAQELYRSYCAEHLKKECTPEASARLQAVLQGREGQSGLQGEALARFEEVFRTIAHDLVGLAKQRGKFESGFTSADGLTESLVSEAIVSRATDVKAARRAGTH